MNFTIEIIHKNQPLQTNPALNAKFSTCSHSQTPHLQVITIKEVLSIIPRKRFVFFGQPNITLGSCPNITCFN